jgi:hypothetical protein
VLPERVSPKDEPEEEFEREPKEKARRKHRDVAAADASCRGGHYHSGATQTVASQGAVNSNPGPCQPRLPSRAFHEALVPDGRARPPGVVGR